MADDRMLSDEILLGIINAKSGGGGGTSDYSQLSNKPQIGGVTLSGDKSASDLGLVAEETGKVLSSNDYTDADKAIVGGVTAALAGKQDALTAGSHIAIDDDTISVNRWASPAGKVVYTVITSDENYGQNVHVQRHTLGGTLIDDRTFLCEMYKTVNIDGLISIQNPYASFNITLLKNSDEHQSGYSYTVNPLTTPTSNSFTFTMEQEENANDLIIRSELSAVSSAVSAITDGQTIDSFADVETALAGKQGTLTFDDVPTDGSNNPVKSNGVYDALATKQDATDNNLTTTDKTTTGAINELKSGLMNLNGYIKTYNSANFSYKKLRITTQYGKQPVIIALVNNGVEGQKCFGMLTSNYGFIGVGTPTVTCDEVNFTIDISLEKYSGDVLMISSRDFTFAEIDPS